jgi:hypothetical protein
LIDAQNINRNLLVLAEEILAGTLEKIYPEIPVAIQEIPEERRDPKCAVRLELIPRGFLSGT